MLKSTLVWYNRLLMIFLPWYFVVIAYCHDMSKCSCGLIGRWYVKEHTHAYTVSQSLKQIEFGTSEGTWYDNVFQI